MTENGTLTARQLLNELNNLSDLDVPVCMITQRGYVVEPILEVTYGRLPQKGSPLGGPYCVMLDGVD